MVGKFTAYSSGKFRKILGNWKGKFEGNLLEI
jgi:hypothetical protein